MPAVKLPSLAIFLPLLGIAPKEGQIGDGSSDCPISEQLTGTFRHAIHEPSMVGLRAHGAVVSNTSHQNSFGYRMPQRPVYPSILRDNPIRTREDCRSLVVVVCRITQDLMQEAIRFLARIVTAEIVHRPAHSIDKAKCGRNVSCGQWAEIYEPLVDPSWNCRPRLVGVGNFWCPLYLYRKRPEFPSGMELGATRTMPSWVLQRKQLGYGRSAGGGRYRRSGA